ncbi:zinc transporter ZIP11 isoform X1 [Schistocerca serialis cubense]|uniref:zinc transporter ZIP11 isoform X1 n=1 Tax=Schistocerca serialis cubense TaxID=2023355 RepID=UPI00214E99C2|nr:zinc transporter ZIP11 isoform X1 [Schistocerca serialis cubense]
MIRTWGPITQALLGTLLTWGITAAGSGMVIIVRGTQRKLLDLSLGFAGGVMIAASYWSLLAPAIEMAEESDLYGKDGRFAFAPVAAGFLLGALFVFGTDALISYLGVHSPNIMLAFASSGKYPKEETVDHPTISNDERQFVNSHTLIEGFGDATTSPAAVSRRRIATTVPAQDPYSSFTAGSTLDIVEETKNKQWKRILLLIVAITVHNIPEGLAVGVGFGAIGSSPSATFENARNLAIGIAIQNFPEGLAVSLPLRATGFSTLRSFWYGQLSGVVEPIFGVVGAATVGIARPLLPYALSFAAGAMVYVVLDDIVPEAHSSGNGKLASWGAMAGFLVMMSLDVGLG